MSVRLVNGLNSVNLSRFAGKRLATVRQDDIAVEALNLTGDEQVSVSRGGGAAQVVNNNFVLQAGDVVTFSRQTGEKGSV